jgi:(1->4)-alpha-D-glucan 1-alpha-D-glucosylmutase
LTQTLLKVTAPGLPDIYQGNEIWDFSLVDPDNRRAVDYSSRQALLTELQTAVETTDSLAGLARQLMQRFEDGRVKLYLSWRCLTLRREHQTLFEVGDYLQLDVKGLHAQHLCAFARQYGHQSSITVVPRLVYRLTGDRLPLGRTVWDDTRIEVPPGNWRNWLSGESLGAEFIAGSWSLSAGEVLQHFPVALLLADREKP